ncbi:CAP domain-containing protein [Sphingobium sp. AN641]|uniref:CAP domain-containing protein n=1 Tax=Sphingobium sp. AN641 TaxID=3133443 RepID=UPI0030BBCCA9
MAGGGPKPILRAGLWAASLFASGAQAASDGAPGSKAAVIAPAAVPTAAVMPASHYGMAEPARGERLLRAAMLDAHNGERALVGVAPLEWDEALAADAARHAADMARTGAFRHSPRGSRAIPSGENLWMGPRRLYGYDVMIGAFADEKRLFRADGKLPDLSTSGRWQDVGHYSQMIWRGTRKVGCALGEGANYDYLVCRYFPAGNAFGQGPLDGAATPIELASGGR